MKSLILENFSSIKVDGVFDEDWVSHFVVQKHVEYLVENDHGKGISAIHNGSKVFDNFIYSNTCN